MTHCVAPGCARTTQAQRLCSAHYQRWRKYGSYDLPERPSFEDRFWARVQRGDGCWEWTGRLNEHGYGGLWFRRKMDRAHRVAWTLTNGEIPAGLCVLHHCDNRRCVRPDHLFVGTQLDNMRDMVAKGRQAHPRPLRGLDHPRGKLSDEDVAVIRAVREFRRPRGKYTATHLGVLFGVSQAHVSRIWADQVRAEVPPAPRRIALQRIDERAA